MTDDKKSRVLVVDDDADMVTSLRAILETSGFDVDVAYGGAEAVERVRAAPPDCILMDIRMPEVNGVEAFRQIKKLVPSSYVIFMTAYATSSLVDEARREGAVEVLSKPLDIEHILDLIKAATIENTILVVDDDPDFCASLRDALAAQSFTVQIAHNLDAALEAFENEPGSVVVLDMVLNHRNGLEGLVIFKEINPRAIVILITAYDDRQSDIDKGLQLSAYAALMKPFDVDELIGMIRRAVASAERRG